MINSLGHRKPEPGKDTFSQGFDDSHKSKKQMSKEILKLIYDLGWEYDRMSSSGQETYDKLADLLGFDDE